MADEPSNAELAWRLDRISAQLGDVIGRYEYAADKRGIDTELQRLAQQVADERRERAAAVDALNGRLTEQAKAGTESRMHWRTVILTGVLPALVAAIGVILALTLQHGGH